MAGQAQRSMVEVLGPVQLHDGSRSVPSRSGMLRTLLALLSLRPTESTPVDAVIDELWGAHLPEDPRAALQVQVSRLRGWLRSAGADGSQLCHANGGYVLDVPPDQVDRSRFERSAERARNRSPADPARVLGACDEALEPWRGDPFDGCARGPRLDAERYRLVELKLQVQEVRAGALLARGDTGAAIAELQALVALHYARESLVALLMRALHAGGRHREALTAFQDVRRSLREHHGLDPGPVLRQLELDILRGQPIHPVTGPERITVPATTVAPERPVLVGRDEHLGRIRDALDGERGRVVLVSGEAGIGKTTLARAALFDLHRRGAVVGSGSWHDTGAPLDAWINALSGVTAGAGLTSRPGPLADRLTALLEVAATASPVALLLEDAHDADPLSLTLLEHLAVQGPPPGTVVVVTARHPDVELSTRWLAARASLARSDAVVLVELGPLSPTALRELVARTLAHLPEARLARLVELIQERSGGHPLHACTLVDQIALHQGTEDLSLVAGTVPDRLRPLLEHQLTGLPETTRPVIEALAVLGPQTPAVLAAILDQTPLQTLDRLRPALRLGLIAERSEVIDFRHALTRQAVLDPVPLLVRQHLHLAWLDRHGSEHADVFDRLRHARCAGTLLARSRLAVIEAAAARTSYARSAFDEAVELLDGSLEQLPPAERVEAELYLGLACAAVGDRARADDLLDRVLGYPELPAGAVARAAVGDESVVARVNGDPRRLRRLHRAHERTTGQASEERLVILQALILEDRLGAGTDRSIEAAARVELVELTRNLDSPTGRAAMASRATRDLIGRDVDPRERMEQAERSYALAAGIDLDPFRLDAIELLVYSAIVAGEFERAEEAQWEYRREADRRRRRPHQWFAAVTDSVLSRCRGDEHAASEAALAALALGADAGVPDAVGAYTMYRVMDGWLHGTLHEVAGAIDRALSEYPMTAALRAFAAVAALDQHEPERAREHLWAFLRLRPVSRTLSFDRAALCVAATAAVRLDDRRAITVLRRALTPNADEMAVAGMVCVLGPLNWYVGLLDGAVGGHRSAAARYREAMALAERARWPAWQAYVDQEPRWLSVPARS